MADNKGALVPKSDAPVEIRSQVSQRPVQTTHTGSGQWMVEPARGTLRGVLYFLGMLISRLTPQDRARKSGDRGERRGNGCGRGRGRGRCTRN